MSQQPVSPAKFFDSIDFTSEGDSVPQDSGVIDFAGEPQAPKPPARPNRFASIEEKLNLPEGSTEDALAALRTLNKSVNGVKTATQNIVNKSTAIVAQTQQVQQGTVKIDPEVLREDRERIRAEAFSLYDSVKELYETMKETFMATVSPPPQMCTAMAAMVNSVQQSLDKLVKVNQALRQESEHYDEKYVKPDLSDQGGEQEYNYSPTQMADLVEIWSNQADEEQAKKLELDVAKRDADKIAAAGGDPEKFIEHKT